MKASVLLVLSVLIFGWTFPIVVFAATTTAQSTIGEQNCGTIDTNWTEYGKTIRGANKKISDVVLNACAALGSVSSCRFNSGYRSPAHNKAVGGATKSQHMYYRAIDLSVPKGREAEFITLAVCGLRKVNNCQGGIGLYQGGAIHVDVRQSSNSIWSNSYGKDSVALLPYGVAKKVLYGFNEGKCTGGSIATSYSEQSRYGPPVKYTIPKDLFKGIFTKKTPAIQSNKSFDPNTLTSQPNPYSGAVNTSPGLSISFLPVDTGAVNTDTTLPATPVSKTARVVVPGPTEGVTPVSYGKDNAVICTDSGWFGTGFLSSCNTDSNTNAGNSGSNTFNATSIPTKGIKSGTIYNSPSEIYTSNNTFQQKSVSIYRAKSQDVFYGTYVPGSTKIVNKTVVPIEQGQQQGVFLNGVAQTKQTSTALKVVQTSTKIAEKSVWYGAYFGFIQGLSPLFIGSAPRTLLQIGEFATGYRGNKAFSF